MGSKCLTTYFIASVSFLSSLYFHVHRIRRRSSAFGTWYCPHGVWDGALCIRRGGLFQEETLPSCQAFRPWPATETGDTWLANTGLWGNPPYRKWAGAPKGIHSSRSSSYSRSGVSFCWGSDSGWYWRPGCQVTSPCKGVITGLNVATGWVLRVGSSAVVAIYFNCQPSEHRRNMVSGRGVGWYFLSYVSTCPCPLPYCCCVLVDHSERDVPPHTCSCVWLGEESWEVKHRVRGTRFRNLGHGADMGKVHIPTCLRCRAEPV